jgi:hypothetical protein
MKYLKMLGLAAVSTMAFMAFASSASATTLETTGVTINSSETISASLVSGTSAELKSTGGSFQNTCTGSSAHGATASPFTATKLSGPLTSLTFSGCTRAVTVHAPGSLTVEHISGTTNGTVFSDEAVVTTGSPVGTLTCETGTGTHIGTLTGVKHGHAELHINAHIPCGISAKWEATYIVTSPTDLGISA